ncbi:MAG TPA: hypothetical protein PKO22_08675 [Treponemataceae bacterium]|nr:hypothetical protein [Treponemataceae bacterium]
MKKTVTGCFAAIALTLLCSCVSTPAPKSDAAPESAPEATTSEVNAASPENPAENSEPVGEVAPAQEKPAETENPPGVPAEEKFLQYYPEPETLVIVPETPAKPVTDKVARTEEKKNPPKPEKKPEAPKAEEKKPAALPEEAKTEEKATAEILPGIWENEPVAPSVMPVESKPAVAPSRKATLAVGQTLEVWYPATGWVYLGDASAQNGLGYQTRKMDKNDTLFTFKAVKEGNYILDFSRYDVLTDGFTADSIAVSVNATGTGKQDKVRAPDYRGANADETQGKEEPVAVTPGAVSGDEPSLQVVQPVGVGESADQASINPDELLQKARASLSNGDAAAALTQLDSFFGLAVSALDEGWFLRGQAYEANTPSRDMKKALEAYETLTAAYPDSARWKDADARIRYIRQFYLRIR